MLRRILRLDEDRVLLEQLRLLLGSVGSAVLPTVFLSGLLVWTLANEGNRVGLALWGGTVIASKVLNYYHARRTLQQGLSADAAPKLVRTLMLLNAADGVAWGVLPWVTLDTASLAGAVLVIAVMAGVKSNAMSALSSIFPVFLTFCLFDAAAIALKLWLMGDPAYHALAVIALLYVGTLIAQSRISANFTRSLIKLRFENTDLIDRLREETEASQAARRDAIQANLAKSKFLAAASHDLRQPIHALGLFLEVIGRGELTAVQREMLENARGASTASVDMLNTLLDFSRIEAGVIQPKLQPVSMQGLLTKIENELAPQATGKGLFYRSRETDLSAMADPLLLELIVRNLVSNAIRYTRQGGVLVGCRRRGKAVWLEVWDTGIGIASDQQREIFQEFLQLGNPERDRSKGLGLGLPIVDRLVSQLGLKLVLKSMPGRGSMFRLELSLSDSVALSPDLDVVYEAARPLKLRVLVIEDDEAIRLGMAQLLQDWGCDCAAVENIEDALEAARAKRPDLLISDYRLRAQRTGAEAILALRAEVGDKLPALLITGDTAPERLREAKATGVPLLHKPVSPSLLYQSLREVERNLNQ